jgi:hypothetical protein
MFTKLIQKIGHFFQTLPDPRKGRNKTYSIHDLLMSLYSMFHMQSMSFLSHQQRLRKKFGKDNGETLFGLTKIPKANQIRSVADKIDPSQLSPLFDQLLEHIHLKDFQVKNAGLVVALDGTYFFSSSKISCDHCLKREHDKGTTYYHAMMCPVLVHPEQKCALPMAPEFIQQQDGMDKQDCEINAAKRWCEDKKEWLEQNKVTILGDDLFSRSPFIKQVMDLKDVYFILVSKASSHTYLNDWIQGYDEQDYVRHKVSEINGTKHCVFEYKMYTDVPLNGDENSPKVNYFEMSVTTHKGVTVYKNTFVTNHVITKSNIHAIARMGRNRWKIENEAFNILKTKGYNLEHNFGHGKKHLASNMALFNLLAFLVHHVAQLYCRLYDKARDCFGARVRFFQALYTITSIMIFKNWAELLEFVSIRFADDSG